MSLNKYDEIIDRLEKLKKESHDLIDNEDFQSATLSMLGVVSESNLVVCKMMRELSDSVDKILLQGNDCISKETPGGES